MKDSLYLEDESQRKLFEKYDTLHNALNKSKIECENSAKERNEKMNKIAMYLLVAFIFYIGGSIEAPAANQNASSCSNSAIQSAINSASDGDTVLVPSGTCAWSGEVTIPSSKGITLQGAGIGSTNITNALIILNTSSSRSPARITGFSLTWSASNGHCLKINPDYSMGSNNWRIDHISFTYDPTGWEEAAIWISGWTFGVVDNCIFSGVPRGVFVESQYYVYDNQAGRYYGDYSWTQSIDLGTPASGYPRAVYVEDCIFNNPKSPGDQSIESRYGARYVFRNNTVNGYTTTTHSGCTNNGRNPVSAEIYKNIINYTNFYRAMHIRTTGTAIVFSNTINGGYTIGMDLRQEESCLGCGANGPYNSAPYSSYPMTDNIGRIPPSQALAPWYEWSNTLSGNPVHFTRSGTCTAEQNLVQNNRDYYAASSGTLASRPSTCTPNAGYFAMDVGSMGTLYQCTSTNTWTAYYTPYSYPHPLRNQSVLSNGSSPKTEGPIVPSGLKIVN